jgi:hypothetical protein
MSADAGSSILDAGHVAWEQAAEEYGRLVVDWVSGGYRRLDSWSLAGRSVQ